MLKFIPWRGFYTLFLIALFIFLYTIFFGYQASISTSFPQWHRSIPSAIGIGASGFILFLLRHYSALRTKADLEVADDSKAKGQLRLAYLVAVFVFLCSAFGVITAATLIIEGPVILREDLARGRERLIKLNETAKQELRLPEYEDLRAQVESKLVALREEIAAPGNCGMGSTAMARFKEIQALLPGLAPLSSDNIRINCADKVRITELQTAYTTKIMKTLDNDPQATAGQYNQRQELLARVGTETRSHDSLLAKAQSELAGVSSLIGRIGIYTETARLLTAANADYVMLRQEVGALARKELELPDDLGSQASENISRPLSAIIILLSRLNYFSTYIYIMLPALADLLMLKLIHRAAQIRNERQQALKYRNQAADLDSTSVTLLWVPLNEDRKRA